MMVSDVLKVILGFIIIHLGIYYYYYYLYTDIPGAHSSKYSILNCFVQVIFNMTCR